MLARWLLGRDERKVVEHLVGEDGLAVHLPFADRHAGDLRDGPQRELRVAVLTDDGGVHVTLCHIGPLTDEPAQPRGVEHGSGREHSAGRQSRDVLGDDGDPRTLLPFRLVESVIGLRSDGAAGPGAGGGSGAGFDDGDVVDAICRAIQRVLA